MAEIWMVVIIAVGHGKVNPLVFNREGMFKARE